MQLRSLKTKFIVYIILLILFISLSFLTFFINRSNQLIEEELTDLGFSLVKNLAYSSELAIASEEEIFLKPYLEGIFKERDVISITVYNRKGYIIASRKKAELEEKIPKEAMEELIKKGDTLKRIDYTKEGEKIYNFFSPIFVSEILTPAPEAEPRELAGFAKVGLSLERIYSQGKSILLAGLGATILVIIFGLGIAVFLAGKMTKPIKQLTKGVEIVGKGDLGHRIEIKTGDEVEELAKSFNQMAEDLKRSYTALEESKKILEVKVEARTKELRELTETLEEKVRERTKEIQERMAELERFHKLTVGREITMINLKEENKELKEEIDRLKKELEKT